MTLFLRGIRGEVVRDDAASCNGRSVLIARVRNRAERRGWDGATAC